MDESILIGKTIERISVDGFDVEIVFTDGTVFEYSSSDGGYSCWNIYKNWDLYKNDDNARERMESSE